MKQPTFHGRVLLPLSVYEAARAGDILAMGQILRYYDGYINKLCTRTLYDKDGSPHVRVPAHTVSHFLKEQAEYIYFLENYWPHGLAFCFFCLYVLVLHICPF